MNVRRVIYRYATPAGWGLYVVAMAGVFLVLTFPYDALHANLLLHLDRRTGGEVRAERWYLRWPAGIAWDHLSFAAPGLPRLQADQLQLDLSLMSLLQGTPVLEGTARLVEGDEGTDGLIRTRLLFNSWSLNGPAQVTGTVEQLDLSKLPLTGVKKGILKSQFEQRWSDFSNRDRFLAGDGTWQMELTGVTLEQMRFGPLALPPLTLSSLTGKLDCQAGTCRIQTVKGEGPDGAFSGEGTLIPREPAANSQLTLTVSLTLADALRQRLNLPIFQPGMPAIPLRVTISGPLSNLQVSL